jgi:hypothetical protein
MSTPDEERLLGAAKGVGQEGNFPRRDGVVKMNDIATITIPG